DALARISLTRRHRQQAAQLLLRDNEVAHQRDLPNLVALALGKVDGDVYPLPVWRDGDLGRGDGEIDIALVLVERLQPLEVGCQLLAGILIAAREDVIPAFGTEPDQLAQLLVGKSLVADEDDLADAGRTAFVDINAHPDPVAGQRRDGAGDPGIVLTAAFVQALQFALDVIENE